MIKDILNTNWYEVMIVSYRALFSLILMFIITRIIGKKQVSELSLFDYVISISIGNFAAEISMNLDSQVMNGFVSVILFGLVATLVSILTLKSILLRRFFMGEPTIIIENGKFIYKNLKRVKMDINDFLETARIAGYFDVSQIKFAVMEANGKMSFLPFEDNNYLTPKDMNIKPLKSGLCANVIIDGEIMENNLKVIKRDEKWLFKQLKVKGKNEIDDILLATVDVNEKLSIYMKEGSNNIKNMLE